MFGHKQQMTHLSIGCKIIISDIVYKDRWWITYMSFKFLLPLNLNCLLFRSRHKSKYFFFLLLLLWHSYGVIKSLFKDWTAYRHSGKLWWLMCIKWLLINVSELYAPPPFFIVFSDLLVGLGYFMLCLYWYHITFTFFIGINLRLAK